MSNKDNWFLHLCGFHSDNQHTDSIMYKHNIGDSTSLGPKRYIFPDCRTHSDIASGLTWSPPHWLLLQTRVPPAHWSRHSQVKVSKQPCFHTHTQVCGSFFSEPFVLPGSERLHFVLYFSVDQPDAEMVVLVSSPNSMVCIVGFRRFIMSI